MEGSKKKDVLNGQACRNTPGVPCLLMDLLFRSTGRQFSPCLPAVLQKRSKRGQPLGRDS